MSKDPEVIDVNAQGGAHHLGDDGVTSGINYRGFHWRNPKSGWVSEPLTALGARNLEFRREEATKNGYEFLECGENCPHHGN